MRRDSFTIRAPGRVNLVGEHIDYCGLPVLPMAIQYGITIRVTPRPDQVISLRNSAPEFEPRAFEVSTGIAPLARGDWGNYVQAAAQALAQRLGPLRGFDGIVTSDLPVASGLSSSSALVVGSAMALLAANGVEMDPLELATLLARGERYVGTAGGGMDQAIIVGARAGHAARIGFNPLELRYVPIPARWRIVVATSLRHAEKSGAVQAEYNARGTDAREALRLVGTHLAVQDIGYRRLLARFGEDVLLDAAGTLEPRLARRFRHIVTEANRVERAVLTLEAGDLTSFGRLLDASHASLAEDYEVSTTALDELVAEARAGGAAGARLTGAGFGGCAIAVVEAGGVERLLEHLRSRFYAPRGVRPGPGEIFEVKSAQRTGRQDGHRSGG